VESLEKRLAAPAAAQPLDEKMPGLGKTERRHIRHRRSKTYWVPLLCALIAAEALALAAIHARSGIAEKDAIALARSLKEGALELEALQAQARKLRDEVGQQAKARLPALRPVEFDRVIPLPEEAFIRNITFTESGTGGHKISEYRVVLENPTPAAVRLRLEILLFDQAGIQIGRGRVGGSRDTASPIFLDAAEVRTYSDRIELDDDNLTPSFYMARLAPPREPPAIPPAANRP
jgi:hypothetical protein